LFRRNERTAVGLHPTVGMSPGRNRPKRASGLLAQAQVAAWARGEHRARCWATRQSCWAAGLTTLVGPRAKEERNGPRAIFFCKPRSWASVPISLLG
jgi:hypothetical protein